MYFFFRCLFLVLQGHPVVALFLPPFCHFHVSDVFLELEDPCRRDDIV